MDTILDALVRYAIPILVVVVGAITWWGNRGKVKAGSDATIADAALKWSIEDRAEMVKLRDELSKTKSSLNETKEALDAKSQELDKFLFVLI